MSLAHLRETKAQHSRSSAAAPQKTVSAAALCGASREPAYRTMDEAGASGLEICGTCVALFRRRGRGH